jgi:hypothetical protein
VIRQATTVAFPINAAGGRTIKGGTMSDQPAGEARRKTPGEEALDVLASPALCERLAALEGTPEHKAEVAEAMDAVSVLYVLYEDWKWLRDGASRTPPAAAQELRDELAAAEDELWSQELFIAERLAGRV